MLSNIVRKQVGNTTYYFGTVGSDKVRSLTFVPVIERSRKTHLEERTEDGYQRPGSLSRMRTFARFLKEHPDHVVPPVLLSSRRGWRFVSQGEGDSAGSLEISAMAAIIDGQHRLGGYVKLFEDEEDIREVPFILLDGLTLKQEMEQFVIVNNSQKGVPKSLTEYLGDSDEAQVAWGLSTEEDSPFKDRITRTGMERKHLFALHSVAKQIKRLFSIGALQDLDVAMKIEYTERFWNIIADRLPNEWSDIEKLDDPTTKGRKDFEFKLLELTGFIAWSICGAQISARSYSEATGMNWDNVRRLVDAAAVIDWNKEGKYKGFTGEFGGAEMAREMLRLLPAEATQVSEA